MRMICSLLLLTLLLPIHASTQQDPAPKKSPLKIHPPTTQKKGDQWQIKINLDANLPDGTILTMQKLPRFLRFDETQGRIVWDNLAPDANHRSRSSQVKGKKTDFLFSVRTPAPTIFYFNVRSDDPSQPPRMEPVREEIILGNIPSRFHLIQKDYSALMNLHRELEPLIKQLTSLEAGKPNHKTAKLFNSRFSEFGARMKKNSENFFTASLALLQNITETGARGAMRVEWKARGREGDGSGGASQFDGGDDQKKDTEEEVPAYGSGLESRLVIFKKLVARETLTRLVWETRHQITLAKKGAPPQNSDLKILSRALTFLEKEYEEHMPIEAVDALRQVFEGFPATEQLDPTDTKLKEIQILVSDMK